MLKLCDFRKIYYYRIYCFSTQILSNIQYDIKVFTYTRPKSIPQIQNQVKGTLIK